MGLTFGLAFFQFYGEAWSRRRWTGRWLNSKRWSGVCTGPGSKLPWTSPSPGTLARAVIRSVTSPHSGRNGTAFIETPFHTPDPPDRHGMGIACGYQIPVGKAGQARGIARRRRIRDGDALTGPVQVAKKE